MDDGMDGVRQGGDSSSLEIPLNWINGAFVTDAMSEERYSTTAGWVEAAIRGDGARVLLLLPAGFLALLGITAWVLRRRRRRWISRAGRMVTRRSSGSGLGSGGVDTKDVGGSAASLRGSGRVSQAGNQKCEEGRASATVPSSSLSIFLTEQQQPE